MLSRLIVINVLAQQTRCAYTKLYARFANMCMHACMYMSVFMVSAGCVTLAPPTPRLTQPASYQATSTTTITPTTTTPVAGGRRATQLCMCPLHAQAYT